VLPDPCALAEPSPLHTTTIVEKCTKKLVDEFNHMRCQASEPLATFLDYLNVSLHPPASLRSCTSGYACCGFGLQQDAAKQLLQCAFER